MNETHPDNVLLVEWMEGKLSDEANGSIEAHLEECDECASRLDALEPNDPFAEQLRTPLPNASQMRSRPAADPTGQDTNLLFGLLAVQTRMIDAGTFVDACALWATRVGCPLSEVLLEQGWITEHQRFTIQSLLDLRSDDVTCEESEVEMDPLSPARTVRVAPVGRGNLQLKELVSTGGIGQVWLAHDRTLGRDVALKELRPEHADNPESRERFHREARISAQLTHPGSVPVHEYRQERDRCFYTMKFLSGQTLTEVIAEFHADHSEGEDLRVERLVPLLSHFVSICNTIGYAHSRQILHRDLKGDNVIVGRFGEVTVLDWGLAKKLERTSQATTPSIAPTQTDQVSLETTQGERLGTPAFMAPEQARGNIDSIDERTDVYGLAGILYEILCGRPPFVGESIHQVLHRVETEPPTPPSEIVSGIPVELEAICLKGLAKEPGDRHSSAVEFGEAVQTWIAQRAQRKGIEQQRERFFSLSLDMLAVLDSAGTVYQLNPAWTTTTGWPVEELLGRSIFENAHPDDVPLIERTLHTLFEGQSLTDIDCRVRCRDGSYKWVHWSATPIPGEKRIGIIGRDLTERQQEAKRFADLLDSAPDAMIVTNERGLIELVNAQTETLFGYSRDELVGEPIENFMPERYRERHREHFADYVREPSVRPMGAEMELLGQHKDGTEFPVEISLSPLATDKGLLVSSAIRKATRVSPTSSNHKEEH